MTWTDVTGTISETRNGVLVELVRYRAWPDEWTLYTTFAGERRSLGTIRKRRGSVGTARAIEEKMMASEHLAIAFPDFEEFRRFAADRIRSAEV